MYEDLIPALATATRIACTPQAATHSMASDRTGGQGACLRRPHTPDRDFTAITDVTIFSLLAESVQDPGVAGVLRLGPQFVRDLAITAGPASDVIISNSHRRLMAHLRAADADAAGREMERFLTCLHFMWRLALCPIAAA